MLFLKTPESKGHVKQTNKKLNRRKASFLTSAVSDLDPSPEKIQK